MLGMADTQSTQVTITRTMQRIIAFMLDNPERKVFGRLVASELGLTSGTVIPLLRRMERHGWLIAEREPENQRSGRSGGPRVFYRFAPRQAAKLRKAIGK